MFAFAFIHIMMCRMKCMGRGVLSIGWARTVGGSGAIGLVGAGRLRLVVKLGRAIGLDVVHGVWADEAGFFGDGGRENC